MRFLHYGLFQQKFWRFIDVHVGQWTFQHFTGIDRFREYLNKGRVFWELSPKFKKITLARYKGAITNTGEEEELTDSDSTSDSDAEASDNLCDSDEDDSELLNDVSPSKLFKFSTSKRVQAIRG